MGSLGLAAAALAGTGYELVQDGALPGKYTLARLDGSCGSAPPAPAGRRPARNAVTFQSAYRHVPVEMITLVPPEATSGRELGAVVALHGAGSSAASLADQLAMAMAAASLTTFAVICVDGGGTYWHRRANGDDPLGMIIHEVLPRAAAAGLITRRIGITGESMGGYGALLLAQRMAAHDVAAVAALSPAIFGSYPAARSANKEAFDNEQDFAQNDVFAGISALRQVPTWVACGVDDPFQPEAALFRARLAALTSHQVPGGILGGCHDEAFWLRNLPAALHFIGGHLG